LDFTKKKNLIGVFMLNACMACSNQRVYMDICCTWVCVCGHYCPPILQYGE
jgi:hypothetical protein